MARQRRVTRAMEGGRFKPIGAKGKGGKKKQQQGPNVHVNKYAKQSLAEEKLAKINSEDAEKRREKKRTIVEPPKPWWNSWKI